MDLSNLNSLPDLCPMLDIMNPENLNHVYLENIHGDRRQYFVLLIYEAEGRIN